MPALRANLKKYFTVAKTSFAESITYRAKTVIWILQGLIWMAVLPFIWLTAYHDQTSIGGFDQKLMVSYFFYMVIIELLTVSFIFDLVQTEIKEGGIVKLLVKPINYVYYNFVSEISSRIIRIILTYLIMLAIFPIIRGYIIVPQSINWLILFGLVLIGYTLYFQIAILVGFVSFWTTQGDWFKHCWWMLSTLAAGYIAPLSFYPISIQRILEFTPFPLLMHAPLQFFLGTMSNGEALKQLFMGVIWALGLAIVVHFVWKRGVRRLDVVGI